MALSIMLSALLLILISGLCILSPVGTQAAEDYAKAIVGNRLHTDRTRLCKSNSWKYDCHTDRTRLCKSNSGNKTYNFDWDYIITFGDKPKDLYIDNRNTNATQDHVYAKSGSIIDAIVHTCCGDFGSLSVLIGDNVTVSADGHVKISSQQNATRIGGCYDEDCKQSWQLPNLKNGNYTLVYFVRGLTEVNELYTSNIKIS